MIKYEILGRNTGLQRRPFQISLKNVYVYILVLNEGITTIDIQNLEITKKEIDIITEKILRCKYGSQVNNPF